ncbi:MAG: hypothetical protein ISS51_02070 [Dehalococcoidales bacterium]|nr:hypothetical protein [Dehalococcoidales bacterium]
MPADFTDKSAGVILFRLRVLLENNGSHQPESSIAESDIELFTEVSGDFNPVHLSQEYAEKTLFGGRIAHGVIAVGLLSAAMPTAARAYMPASPPLWWCLCLPPF